MQISAVPILPSIDFCKLCENQNESGTLHHYGWQTSGRAGLLFGLTSIVMRDLRPRYCLLIVANRTFHIHKPQSFPLSIGRLLLTNNRLQLIFGRHKILTVNFWRNAHKYLGDREVNCATKLHEMWYISSVIGISCSEAWSISFNSQLTTS